MRLIWVHSPSWLQLAFFDFQFVPFHLFDHKLSRDFVPSFLPINPCVKDNDSYRIYPCVVSDESKPAICHCSEFILELNQTIVIQLILVKCSLLIKLNWIVWTQLLQGNYLFFYFLYFRFTLYVSFERTQEKAV